MKNDIQFICIILFLLIIVILLYCRLEKLNKEHKEKIKEYSKRFQRKKILTPCEIDFFKELYKITCKYNVFICPQVAIEEICSILNTMDKKYREGYKAMRIDFCIVDYNFNTVLCIELDDYTHNNINRIYRDKFVNELFKSCDIPLHRIKVSKEYNLSDIDTYLKKRFS